LLRGREKKRFQFKISCGRIKRGNGVERRNNEELYFRSIFSSPGGGRIVGGKPTGDVPLVDGLG